MKHKHFVEEVEDSKRLLKDGHHHLKDKHETLVKKAKEHGRWVRTFLLYIEDLNKESEWFNLILGSIFISRNFILSRCHTLPYTKSKENKN